MNVNEFMSKAVSELKNEITDLFFLYIQSDKTLMKDYLDTVASEGNLKSVNSRIAKELCRHFSLSNSGVRNSVPKSSLIQSYSELEGNE